MQDLILVVNSGSSSIKFSAYAAIDKEEAALLLKGQVEGVGTAPHMIAKNEEGAIIFEKRWGAQERITRRYSSQR